MRLSSPAFEHEGTIPAIYSCDGKNSSPPLMISDIPEGTKTLALLMDDPDIPDFVKEKYGIRKYDHWVLFNITPTAEITEGTAPGTQGKNSAGTNTYTGPCPPDREHRYFFRLYAVDTALPLAEGATMTDVEQAMKGHVLAEATLMGRYTRQG